MRPGKIIQPSTKKYKTYSTKKYATKTKKSKKYKTKKIKKVDTRKPSDEAIKRELIAKYEVLETELVDTNKKPSPDLVEVDVEQVADQNAATITKNKKKPKKKKKATQSDINRFSKVKNGKSEGIEVTPAGQE